MKKMYKAMALLLCAVLLVAGSVMGTMAFLQSQTKTISNVMTVGNVKITLTEKKMEEDGLTASNETIDAAEADQENNYKLIPGRTYTKNPTVTVKADSEACYVYVKVINGIAGLEAKDEPTIADQMTANGWNKLENVADVYFMVVNKVSEDKACPVFSTFTVADNANALPQWKEELKITITAYAVQKDGFDTAVKAWNATFGANN